MPTESQLQDAALRVRIRERVENGLLPVMVPEQIHGGYGAGDVCIACDHPITSTQIEYELEDPQAPRRLHFHLGCHVLWQMACAQVLRGGDQSQSDPPA